MTKNGPDTSGSPASRPNILLICTDQQRFDAARCYGNPHIQTPALDRLASEGVLFENCYVQNPVCGPSRASLMTGQYVHSHGLWANGVNLPRHETLFTKALDGAGYDCGLVGKFHLGACHPDRLEPRLDDGFRVFRWSHGPAHASSENQYHRWLKASHPHLYDAARDPESAVTFDTMPTEGHYSHWIGEETVDFIRSARRVDRPFCFVANFFDPHHPFGSPKEYTGRYDPEALPGPITVDGELTSKPPILTEASRESYAGHARGYLSYSRAELQDAKAAYYAMVSLIDDEVARILATLEEEGLAEDTVVIYTSDHGEMLGDHQLMLKGPMMYECAVRVPLIIRWPARLPAGERRTELVQWIDLAPTLLDAAGLPSLPRSQGASLLPLARGELSAAPRDWALCEYRDSGHAYDPPVHTTMLRHDRWKIIVHHPTPTTSHHRTGEMYDLVTDPDELTNLWEDSSTREIRTGLQEMLLDVLVATENRGAVRLSHW